jgi:hypothetical protein
VGTLRAAWIGVDTTIGAGRVTLPVKAVWCAPRGRLTLLAFTGDTGVGILIRTVKLEPGLFAVSDTAAARSPGSGIAFRIRKEGGFFTLSGDSGAVAITSVVGGKVAGRFLGWFSGPASTPVVLDGSFRDVTALPDSVRCEGVS